MNLIEEAKAYEPKKTKVISDLDVCATNIELYDVSAENKEGETFTYKAFKIGEEEYRVPLTVLEQLKAILAAKPGLLTFKVLKKGEGLSTKYQVIALE